MTGQQALKSAALKSAPPVAGVPSAAQRAEETLRRVIFSQTGSITDAFLRINRNRDGVCDAAELAAIFRNANVPLKPDELAAIVKRVDVNGDGKLNIGELAKLLENISKYAGHTARAQTGVKRARA